MSQEEKRALELFSGIGGWSCALRVLGSSCSVVGAFDINLSANAVYAANFPSSPRPNPKSLETLTTRELDAFRADLWMMSPPCQPHTRNNTSEHRDSSDPRSKSFLHLIEQLKAMKYRPQGIILENVVGFDSSACCRTFLEALTELQFNFEQYILSPEAFGIPNSRPRYYCIAWQAPAETFSASSLELRTVLPGREQSAVTVRPIGDFLAAPSRDLDAFVIPLDYVRANLRACWCWDIVRRGSTASSCFTKAYGRYHKGTGSIVLEKQRIASSREDNHPLQPPVDSNSSAPTTISTCELSGEAEEDKVCATEGFAERQFDSGWLDRLLASEGSDIELRYFTPQELLRLFGFQDDFFFPPSYSVRSRSGEREEELTARKCYELIGNSINITVSSAVLATLLCKLS